MLTNEGSGSQSLGPAPALESAHQGECVLWVSCSQQASSPQRHLSVPQAPIFFQTAVKFTANLSREEFGQLL